MSNQQKRIATEQWSNYQVLALKFLSIFFVLLIFPLDPKFYGFLFAGGWLDFHITDLVKIVSYLPSFFNETFNEHNLGLNGFYSWWLIAVIAIAGIIIWNVLEKKNHVLYNYDLVYHWVRVVLRYKLAFILIAYGSLKLYALQYPFPSLSNLYTHYGDFLPWKIWAHTIGIAPNYEAFLGGAEILAALLILSRKMITFGAALTIGIHTNVLFASFSYELGNQVLATFVFISAFFIFSNDISRIYSLLFLEKTTPAEQFSLTISDKTKIPLKALAYAFGFTIVLSAVFNMETNPYLTPKEKGLKNAFGFYNVKEFILNNDTIPYSRTNPDRWQNVVFEKWATISVKTAEPVKLDSSLYFSDELNDIDRVYESAGVSDRRYYSYTIDSVKQTLHLHNKNANYAGESYNFHLERPNEQTIILEGLNKRNDHLKAVLERADRKFLLIESRRFPIEL